MIIKSFSSFWLLYLLTLLACGQTNKQDEKISQADSIKVSQYEQRSALYQNTAPDSAILLADTGLKLSRHLHYRHGEGLMLNRFARINEQYGNFKLSIKYQNEALVIFKDLHDTKAYADASANLGELTAEYGNPGKGIQLINKALSQYKKSRDTGGIIQAYIKIGKINVLDSNYEKALVYYKKAEALYGSNHSSPEYFSLISDIGKLHTELNDNQQAVDYFEMGINKSLSSGNTKAYISLLNNAGKTLNTLGDTQKALFYHEEGLKKAKEFGLPEEEARSLIGIAGTLGNRDADLSIKHLKNALAIAHNIGHKQLSSEIYYGLSVIYRQQSRYKEAMAALEAHHHLVDSLLILNKGHKIAVLQNSYELAESRLRIESLELTNRHKTYQRNLLLLVALSTFVVLLVLAGYFYKTNRLNKKLEETNRIKDRLFSIIGHDLRNPISGITQLLAIMEEGNLTAEESGPMISEMKKQGDVTLEILNALLNWGEAQLKGIHIESSKFNAKNIITKNITALHKMAEDKAILIKENTPDDLMIFGDINHFDFVIRNLISNAIKFSYPSGNIEISVKTDSKDAIFSVSDHGKGISKQQQSLFVKSNLDVAFGTAGEKGTGIGLMLSKEFIKANHGYIRVESEEEKGTTFYFSFPVQN